jgi:H+/Cl- antiporter ClcA
MSPGNDRFGFFLSRRRLPRVIRVVLWRLLRWWHRLEILLARNFGLATHEDRVFFILVPLVGFMAGLTGFLVTLAISAVQRLVWGAPRDIVAAAHAAPNWVTIAAPIVGGITVGFIIWRSRRNVSGHGISGIIETVNLRNGEVRPRPVLLRLLAAIATVGTGGSLGREGPTIGTGAMLGSWRSTTRRSAPPSSPPR